MKAVLVERGLTGSLSWEGHRVDVTFDLRVGPTGDIRIAFRRIRETPETFFLHQAFNAKGRYVEMLDLRSLENDDVEASGEVTLVSKRAKRTKRTASLYLKGTSFEMNVLKRPAKEPSSHIVEYLVPGLRSFGPLFVTTPTGEFSVVGSARTARHDQLNGYIRVECEAEHQADADSLDDQVDRLLEILSLANGRLIRWSVRRRFAPSERLRILLRGPQITSSATFPLFPHLHLKPAVEMALARYTPELRVGAGLGVAIAWSLMRPQYPEADFLCAMTALEHLVDTDADASGSSTLIDKDLFSTMVRPDVESAIRSVLSNLKPPIPADVEMQMLSKIRSDLNRVSLRQKIESFVTKNQIPVDDLIDDMRDVITLRNDIVHRGIVSGDEGERLDKLAAVLRELLARTYLTMLAYEGPYYSYLEGAGTLLQFPQRTPPPRVALRKRELTRDSSEKASME